MGSNPTSSAKPLNSLLALREQSILPEQIAPFHLGAFLASFIHPLRSRDFVFTLLSRLLIFFTFTMIGSYLLFYVREILHAPSIVAAHGVFVYQLISTVMLLIVAPLTGYLFHRFHRIKPFVCVGALLMALGTFVIALLPSWTMLFSASTIFGCGFGLYLGVDIILAVKVLPNQANRGKDLGVIYTSIFLPLIATPIIGAGILNSFQNFALLFTVAGISSLLAALLILPIETVH